MNLYINLQYLTFIFSRKKSRKKAFLSIQRKKMRKGWLLLLFGQLYANSVFHALDPFSLQQNLAFYELYPDTQEGKEALKRASLLIGADIDSTVLLKEAINPFGRSRCLDAEKIKKIETLAAHFPNRKLEGYFVTTEEEILNLETEEVDLGKALILSQTQSLEKAQEYSALLDLMAMQIEAKFAKNCSTREKIEVMNQFVFETMHFRFPPHALFAKNVDQYTFLADVMDDHLGVCLGVSTLILALSQRLGIPLESITPPGHIYVRYRDDQGTVVIETTARGVDMPEEKYLSIHTHQLFPRTIKEVIGMAHFNEASIFLQEADYEKAKLAYRKAAQYMKDDALLEELLGLTLCFSNEEEEGKKHLKKAVELINPFSTQKRNLAEDYLLGVVDQKGIEAVILHVDENSETVEKKKDALLQTLEKSPKFREGLHQLGVAWVMLKKNKKAIETFEKLHEIDATDPVVCYYLTILHGQRRDFKKSWDYLDKTLHLLRPYNVEPKAIKELRQELMQVSPRIVKQEKIER